LRIRDEDDFVALMERHENTGWPLGDKPFVRKLEKLLGRALAPGRPGRPKRLENSIAYPDIEGLFPGATPNPHRLCAGNRAPMYIGIYR